MTLSGDILRRSQIALLAFLFVPVLALMSTEVYAGDFDVDALAKQGAKSQAQYETTPCSYDRIISLTSADMVVSVLHAGKRNRLIFTIQGGNHSEVFCKIISRDGLWYVTRQNETQKFRPFELTEVALFYQCLQMSNLTFFNTRMAVAQNVFTGINGGNAIFSTPLPDDQATGVRSVIAQADAVLPQMTGANADQTRQMRDKLKDLLVNGVQTRVDSATGLIVELDKPSWSWRTRDFKLLDKIDETEFSVDGTTWEDNTEDLTKGNLNDLAMLSHAPGYLPGDKNYELDTNFIDIGTGRFRRIPFEGTESLPGCFLPGRKSVVVCGALAAAGGIRPYKINLSTRENRPLGAVEE